MLTKMTDADFEGFVGKTIHSVEQVKKFRETGEGQYLARRLMVDMCNRGLIPEGKYVINVSW